MKQSNSRQHRHKHTNAPAIHINNNTLLVVVVFVVASLVVMIVVVVVNVVAAAAMSGGTAPVEAAPSAAGRHDVVPPPGSLAPRDRGLPHGSVQHADDNTNKFYELWEFVMWMQWDQGCAKKDITWLRAENQLLKEKLARCEKKMHEVETRSQAMDEFAEMARSKLDDLTSKVDALTRIFTNRTNSNVDQMDMANRLQHVEGILSRMDAAFDWRGVRGRGRGQCRGRGRGIAGGQ